VDQSANGGEFGGNDLPITLPPNIDEEALLAMMWQVVNHANIAVFWKDLEGRLLGANNVFFQVCGIEDGYETPRASKVPVTNDKGEVVAVMGFFHGVAHKLEAERALRTLEGRYAVALDASRDGMWELDLVTDQFEVSPRFYELLEIDVGSADPDPDLELDQIRSTIRSLIEDEAELEFHHRQEMTDGDFCWFQITGLPFEDDDGKITHVIGTLVDVTEQMDRESDLIFQAAHDDLTGLHNRRALLSAVEMGMERNQAFSLLYLDLDEFKLINDSLGHKVGDDLLEAMAGRLASLTYGEQLVARLGGDEFAVFVPDASPEDAEALGQRVLDTLSDPLVLDDTEIYITCSVGVVHSNDSYASALEVLRDGDIALYSAKRLGKSRVQTFERTMRAEADRALELQNRVRGAVDRDEFLMHYQPIVDSSTGSIWSVEALIRWLTPDGELLPAGNFLPYLEQTGLMLDVGEWIIRESISQLALWRDEYAAAHDVTLSINLSRMQFHSPRLCNIIINTLEEHKIDPTDLIVEVTETAVSDGLETMVETLQRLRDVGIQVAIDDFGVGQSSLSALYDLPVDIIKIDRAFVSRIREGSNEPMIDAVLALAASAGLTSTAEGVETDVQRSYLEAAGCEHLQGYLLGMPMSPEELGRQFLVGWEERAA